MFGYHDLQNISRKQPTELCEIMHINYSDKSSLHLHHNYSLLYETMFSEFRNKENENKMIFFKIQKKKTISGPNSKDFDLNL
jgi:hypothetical protein